VYLEIEATLVSTELDHLSTFSTPKQQINQTTAEMSFFDSYFQPYQIVSGRESDAATVDSSDGDE
jgi:hypothetical protein